MPENLKMLAEITNKLAMTYLKLSSEGATDEAWQEKVWQEIDYENAKAEYHMSEAKLSKGRAIYLQTTVTEKENV